MKKNLKQSLIYIVVIIFTFFQCYILIMNNSYNIDNNTVINNKEEITNNNQFNAKEIQDYFKNYKTITIVNYDKQENDTWKIKCILRGNKEDVLRDIENIDLYKIVDYNLNYENNNLIIEGDFVYK